MRDEVLDRLTCELWEMASKYRRLLRRDAAPPTAESEADRQKVSPLYAHLQTSIDRHLDGEVYKLLTRTQNLRDERALWSSTSPRRRLARIGVEVAIRRQPMLCTSQRPILSFRGLLRSLSLTPEEESRPQSLLPGTKKDVPDLPKERLEALQIAVTSKLGGRSIALEELPKLLTPDEATMLSQMARKGEVVVLVQDGHVTLAKPSGKGEPPRTSVAILIASK